MYDSDPALRQEWAVFCALAPQELLDLILAPDLDQATRAAMETMFIRLGFFELSLAFRQMRGSNRVLQELLDRTESDARGLLHLFLDNIHSESLHDLFDKKVDYYD